MEMCIFKMGEQTKWITSRNKVYFFGRDATSRNVYVASNGSISFLIEVDPSNNFFSLPKYKDRYGYGDAGFIKTPGGILITYKSLQPTRVIQPYFLITEDLLVIQLDLPVGIMKSPIVFSNKVKYGGILTCSSSLEVMTFLRLERKFAILTLIKGDLILFTAWIFVPEAKDLLIYFHRLHLQP